MKALVYHGPGQKSLDECPEPTICGTDFHILKRDVPSCTRGRITGHEGVGIVDSIGAAVTR